MSGGCITSTEIPAWSAKRGHSNLGLRQRVLPPLVLPVTGGVFYLIRRSRREGKGK